MPYRGITWTHGKRADFRVRPPAFDIVHDYVKGRIIAKVAATDMMQESYLSRPFHESLPDIRSSASLPIVSKSVHARPHAYEIDSATL